MAIRTLRKIMYRVIGYLSKVFGLGCAIFTAQLIWEGYSAAVKSGAYRSILIELSAFAIAVCLMIGLGFLIGYASIVFGKWLLYLSKRL